MKKHYLFLVLFTAVSLNEMSDLEGQADLAGIRKLMNLQQSRHKALQLEELPKDPYKKKQHEQTLARLEMEKKFARIRKRRNKFNASTSKANRKPASAKAHQVKADSVPQ